MRKFQGPSGRRVQNRCSRAGACPTGRSPPSVPFRRSPASRVVSVCVLRRKFSSEGMIRRHCPFCPPIPAVPYPTDLMNMARKSGRGLPVAIARESGRGQLPFSCQLRTTAACQAPIHSARPYPGTCG
ncbi:hypothetical protein PF003_g38983 [Phytophthora fragariae]|nr:hypothetical protein PF003_g38983 [Phytophthora fragariae]